jgi:mannose-1-phosphate guanylyltransferase
MFQHALDRLSGFMPLERVMVVTAREYMDDLAAQAPDLPLENFILEPMPRGTAGAIGLSAVYLERRDPEAVMAVLTADHYIREVDTFRRVLSAAARSARQGFLVTLGIKPSFPSTGYGYVRRSEQVDEIDGFAVYTVDSFVEKPDLERAQKFLETRLYSWNSGMFIWRVRHIMDEFARQMPDVLEQLREIQATLDTPGAPEALSRIWPQVRRNTIDYGIMEGARNVVVIPVDLGWTDIGDWAAISNLHETDEHGNVVIDADHIGVDTRACFIRGGDKLIATIGLEDLIIIETDDALLICPRNRAQDVKSVVEQLERNGRDEYL